MSTVVEELVVELNARTERLEQGLAKARAEIGKTVPSTTAAGAAGSKMGQQFAAAADKMGQLGSQAGATTSQMLEQGKTLSSVFGASSGVVGGISIVTLAVVGIGVAAVKMAGEVDKGLRQVEARVPGTTAQMARLRDTIEEMSTSGPNSQATLAAAAAEIARQGVGTIEEVQQRLAAVTKVADATGEDVMGIVAGLDQAMDMFGIASKDSEAFLAKLYATAANKMPITDLFAAFQTAAPAVRAFGLDADTTMRALGALLEKGMSAKQAGSELKAYAAAGAEGAAEIQKLADSFDVAADASTRLDAAQQKMNSSVDAVSAQIKNKLNAELIDLGRTILPIVEQAVNGVVIALDTLLGKVGKIYADARLRTLLTGFSTSGQGKSGADVKGEMVRLDEAARGRKLDLGGFSVAELDKMLQTIRAVAAETKTSEAYFGTLKKAIAAAREEAVKLEAAGGAPKKSGLTPTVRTADEITAGKTATKEKFEASLKIADEAIKVMHEKWKDFTGAQASALEFIAKQAAQVTGDVVTGISLMFADAIQNAPTDEAKARATALRDKLIEAKLSAMALSQSEEDVRNKMIFLKDETIKFGDSIDKNTERIIAQARATQQAIDGALQLAQAFGQVDEKIINSLRGVNQIVGSIPALSEAWSKRGGTEKGEGMGALVGAALPVAGAVASIVGGFLSAAKAAREHAKALQEASRQFTKSLQDRIDSAGLNSQQARDAEAGKKRLADINAMLDTLVQVKNVRIGTRDDFLAKDTVGQRKVLTDALAKEQQLQPAYQNPNVIKALQEAIKQFDLVGEAARLAAKQVEEELAAKRKDIDGTLAERRLKLAGKTEEADALAFVTQQERELAAARAEGVYTAAQLVELETLQNEERAKYVADARRRREDEEKAKAQDVARTKEDLQSRINAADGETPAERALRVSIEQRRELEDAMAAGADAATLALISMAHSAENAAAATAAAAAAMQAVVDAQRDMEDLDVRMLRAQGNDDEADTRAFTNQQTREYEDAVADGKDAGYLDALRATQAEELKAFLQGLVDTATGGGGGAASGEGATSASGTGIGTATIVQVDRMLGLLGTLAAVAQQSNTELIKQTALMARGSGWAIQPPSIPSEYRAAAAQSMAGATVVQLGGIRVNVIAPDGTDPRAFGFAISQAVLDAINTGLASSSLLTSLGKGQVGR